MNNRLIDTLDRDQRRALENVRESASHIWERPLHRYYTDHTVAHSERIVALLDGLTAGMMATDKRLSITEVVVVLAAAYLHDIGMQNEKYAAGSLGEIRAHHHEQTAEMIYAVFEDPANAFPIPLARDPAFVEAVALVAKGHRRVDLNGPEYEPFVHGGETLRLRLLAALLRFADELDIDYRRVDLEQMKLLALPVESQLHWWRCHYVGGVSIIDGYIRVGYRFPRDRPDYENLIVPLVETEIRKKLADLEEIFWAGGVKVALGKPQVRLMRPMRPLPSEVEALIRQELQVVDEDNDHQAQHLFICYKQNVDSDQRLADYLHELLTAHDHDVFIDDSLRTGEAWLEEIDRQIKASDFLIVLLSKESADSEMVQAEVRRAYEYRKLQGHPHTLPVHIAYEGLLPYSIDAFLSPVQYVVWESEADDERVGSEILAAIEGRLPNQTPIQARPAAEGFIVSEDGRVVDDDETLHPPLPEFDPRWLEAPGGAVRLRSRFYVRRGADSHLERQVVQPGTMTTIRAARQTGKSSLLVRGMHHARQQGAKVVHFDLQRLDRDHLQTPDVFLRFLAEFIVGKLRLDVNELGSLWRDTLGPQDNLTRLIEDYVLPESDTPIVLAMDEVDRLLTTPFHSDFFALVRFWYNSAAFDVQWEKLNIVMVISTEPFLLVTDLNQSPFNVGLSLYLEDFSVEQVRDLNLRHGAPVRESDFPLFMELLHGHPYLTRKALYTMVANGLAWPGLVRTVPSDQGPFGDHLRRYCWILRNHPDLREALRQVVRQNRCDDDMAFYRLLRAGLVKGSGDVCRCRCDLYRIYFKDKL